MSTLNIAIKESGIKIISVRRRIWGWLKEHPKHTAAVVAMEFKTESAATVITTVYQLQKAGYLIKESPDGAQRNYLYSVSADTYRPCFIPEIPVVLSSIVQTETQASTTDVENMPLKAARQLYDKLREFFKEA